MNAQVQCARHFCVCSHHVAMTHRTLHDRVQSTCSDNHTPRILLGYSSDHINSARQPTLRGRALLPLVPLRLSGGLCRSTVGSVRWADVSCVISARVCATLSLACYLFAPSSLSTPSSVSPHSCSNNQTELNPVVVTAARLAEGRVLNRGGSKRRAVQTQ